MRGQAEDRDERGQRRRLTARVGVVIAFMLVVVVAFGIRLVDIQVVSAASYNTDAESRRVGSSVVYGTRGNIVDRNGAVLAESTERYDITISPKIALGYTEINGSILPMLEGIGQITGQDPTELLNILQRDPESDYAVLARGLTLEQYLAIRELKPPGVYGVRVPGRIYPNGAVAGNLVGFLGTDEPLAGFERSEDQCLAAQDGKIIYQRSADGVAMPGTEVTEVPAVDGGTLQLTVDRDLQWYVQEALAKIVTDVRGTWGSAIVVDVTTGEILALADVPTLDPNDFQSADASVTGSRSFAIPYEPGSVMKPVVMAMLMDQGLVSPTEQINAPYSMDFGDKAGRIYDWGWHNPHLTAAGVLAESSNTGIAQLAERMPDQQRYEYLQKFGFGSKSGIGFTGESGGLLRSWDAWDARTRLNIAFGHGISTTILQLAEAYATIANHGVSMPLSLVESCTLADGTVVTPERAEPEQVVSQAAADTVVSMMENDTAFYAKDDDVLIPGYRIAAKTGTAYVAENGAYTNKTTISYAGIAPADNPRYLVIASVGTPYRGNSHLIGAPVRNMLAQALTRNEIGPSSGDYVHYPLYW